MADHWICIIPKDPYFVPSEEAILEAEEFLAEIAPDANEISSEAAAMVKLRDCGANLMSIRCPVCAVEIASEWWLDQIGGEDGLDSIELRPISLPCGHVASSLNELVYDFDLGFSQFIVEARNPNLGELTSSQVRHFEAVLGCPMKIIYRHL